MQDWIIYVLERFGYIGAFLMMMLENIFPPIPSEAILAFGGFITTETGLSAAGLVAATTAGSVTGAAVLYKTGRELGTKKIEGMISKWGRLIRLKKEDLHNAKGWFMRYGYWTVFFCRMIPIVRSLISIPAGMARMKFGAFLLLTAAGTLIWNLVLIRIGIALGESWEEILHFMEAYSLVAYVILGLLAVVFMIRRVRRRDRSK
jgi:membrane protein DedA with SNARE-associated domain